MTDNNPEVPPADASAVEIVDEFRSDKLLVAARATARQRAHLLLHENHADPVQRLLVAFEHGTYIQPHCHTHQWEMIVPLRGVLRLLMFSRDGRVIRRVDLQPHRVDVVEVPTSAWHTLVAVSPTALMLEVKPGPYRPAEFADWAPQEQSPRVPEFGRWMLAADVGDQWEQTRFACE